MQLDRHENIGVHAQVLPVYSPDKVDAYQTEREGEELVEDVAADVFVTEAFIEGLRV